MSVSHRWFYALLLTAVNTCNLYAFKPITHVWIAQQVINDLSRTEGGVIIDGERYVVDEVLAKDILQNPGDYRMGFIGPDVFPDPVVGQMTVHPGFPFETDKWLREILNASDRSDRMRSFAYGYVGHAASDIFAHSYVNTYSGDIFVLSDAKGLRNPSKWNNEEKRHFALEGFIARFTPRLRDSNGVPHEIDEPGFLTVPAELVADLLIPRVSDQSNQILEAYKQPKAMAAHIVLMTDYRDKVERKYKDSKQALVDSINKLSLERTKANAKDRPALDRDFSGLESHLRDLDYYYIDWLNGINSAISAYIRMGGEIGIEFSKKGGDPTKPLKKWQYEYLPKFTSPPWAKKIQALVSHIEKMKNWPLIRQIRGIKKRLEPIKKQIIGRLAHAFLGKSNENFFDLVYEQRFVGDDHLNAVFSAAGSEKKLLIIKDIAARVKFDMGIRHGEEYFCDSEFAAVADALLLSKLTLLGPDELNRLIKRYDQSAKALYSPSNPFNILLESVKSIDGDHQWNAFPPPYLRTDAKTCYQEVTGYGYEYTGNEGFKIWGDENLRQNVFRKLFTKMLNPGLYDPQAGFENLIKDPCYTYRPSRLVPFPDIEHVKR
jgi:hypothetical protein